MKKPMRWRYSDMAGVEEGNHEPVRQQINAWWKEFQRKAGDLGKLFAGKSDWDLPQWMQDNLQCIDSGLMWEFGPAVRKDGHRLVITVESDHYLRPLAQEILRLAPKIKGWEFYGYRLAEPLDQAIETVVARTGGSISDTMVHVEIGEFNRIDCLFTSPNYQTSQDCEKASGDVFVATETLAGEEYLNRWVGAIEVVPWKEKTGDFHPLSDFKFLLDDKIVAVQESLPSVPVFELSQESQWTLYKLKPREAEDYPSQLDMFVGKAMIESLWQNGHSGVPFDSQRYSTGNETFCFLKLDGREADKDDFEDKGEIEDALDKALKNARLGCYIGGGTGLIYSYVDLALTDIGKAIPLIQDVLRKGKINRRSWLLFYDTTLEWEWIGIWDDSPPPPRADKTKE